MSPDQPQTQFPQPGQEIPEGQVEEDKGQGGNLQEESRDSGHLMEEGDGIPGSSEDAEAPDAMPGEGSDARQTSGGANGPDDPA